MTTPEFLAQTPTPDPIEAFLTQFCEVTGHPSDATKSRDLVAAFETFQQARREIPWQPQTVARRLLERAGAFRHPLSGNTYLSGRRGVACYLGIRLTPFAAERLRKSRDRVAVAMPRPDPMTWAPDEADADPIGALRTLTAIAMVVIIVVSFGLGLVVGWAVL